MVNNRRLQLDWIGKEDRPQLEPRILLPDAGLSYHAKARVSEADCYDNVLIHGDNLLALKAMVQDYTGKFRCVVIDPPYNTGSAFQQYDDGLEHSIWLGLMRDRLEVIRELMADDGSLWITIDDHESHYLKVVCDETFGRANFVGNVVWQKKSSPQPNARWLSDSHDHVLVFAKNKELWRARKLPREKRHNEIYNHSDEWDGIDDTGKPYGRGPWYPGDATASLTSGARGRQYAASGQSANLYPVVTPSGRTINPPAGTCWRYSPARFKELVASHEITFGPEGNNRPCIKRFLEEMKDHGITPMTVWHYKDVGENRTAKAEVKAFNPDDPFATPKPERLIARILTIATDEGDWVLDSFAGSGTTGAVAHKMRRQWVMVELGDHCYTHVRPRLNAVIDGKDPKGVTLDVHWEGGGGYRFFTLAPSLLERDKWDNWVVSSSYNGPMLAEAMCKHEGFSYSPDPQIFWMHGQSSEEDFIYVTDQTLTAEQLEYIATQVGGERSLLVCCSAWRGKAADYPNLTLKKIPQSVLSRCEWGRDDYSLNVEELTPQPELGEADVRRPARQASVQELPLFAGIDAEVGK